MIGPAWTLPMEAIRHCVTADGAVVLARLDTEFARFKPHQRVELTPAGFAAYVCYELPPYRGALGMNTVLLTWAARENSAMAPPSPPPFPFQGADAGQEVRP
jgi:hypothetical protein